MADTTQNVCAGVRNPYALAELIRGEKINWQRKSHDKTMSILENTFGMPAERLFDPKYQSLLYTSDINVIKHQTLGTQGGNSLFLCTTSDYQEYTGNYINASGMKGTDPVQSARLKNCSLIAGIASCAWTGKTGNGGWYKTVTADLPMANASANLNFFDYNGSINPVPWSRLLPQSPLGTLMYAQSTRARECWPAVIEKGYYQSRGYLAGSTSATPDPEYYNDDTRNPTGVPVTTLYQLTGVPTFEKKKDIGDYSDKTIWDHIVSISQGARGQMKIKYPAVAYAYAAAQSTWIPNTIVPGHSYSLLGVSGTLDATTVPATWKTRYIVLRDPWAVTTDPSFTSNEMLMSGTWLQGVDFSKKDGIFAIRADLFPDYFQGYAWAPTDK